MKQELIEGFEIDLWRPCHRQGHHGGWNTLCRLLCANVEMDPQTNTECCPRKFYIKHQAEETASNIQVPENLKGFNSCRLVKVWKTDCRLLAVRCRSPGLKKLCYPMKRLSLMAVGWERRIPDRALPHSRWKGYCSRQLTGIARRSKTVDVIDDFG